MRHLGKKSRGRGRPKKAKPIEKSYSLAGLSIETGHDRHTIQKICRKLKPLRTVNGYPQWRLSDVEAALEQNPPTSRALLEERLISERLSNERMRREEAEARRELIATDEAMLIWGKVLLVVRQRLASLPHEAAAPANPTDPAHAFKALTEWADSSARQISQHLPQMATAGKAEDEVDVKSQCASRTTTG